MLKKYSQDVLSIILLQKASHSGIFVTISKLPLVEKGSLFNFNYLCGISWLPISLKNRYFPSFLISRNQEIP